MPFKAPSFRPAASIAIAEQRDREHDKNRPDARERGYDNKWVKARKTFLSHRPDCVMMINGKTCGAQATVVDHIVPHRGDQARFWDKSNWQPLCVSCHSILKQSDDRLGAEAQRRSIPFDVGRSRIPVTMVCGPAGSGKSTYVKENAWATDICIDLDVIRARLAGTEIHHPSPEYTGRALDERNRILRSLASDHEHTRAWFIIAAPERAVRDTWANKLGAIDVVVLETPVEECVRRIRADTRRFGQYERMETLAVDWWARYSP